MKALFGRAALIATAVLSIGLSGCATVTPEQLAQAMDMARQAQSEAAAAKQAAGAAQMAADKAASTAGSAQRTAQAAQAAADKANNCCSANTEKMDRMFREAVRK